MKKLIAAITFLILWAVPSDACTSVIVSAEASATGRPLMWKQRDSSAGRNYMDYFAATEDTYAFTGIVNTDDRNRESVWCGSNQVGFSIMNTQSYGLSMIITDERPYEGMIMKKALETCRTVDDFEYMISSLPQPNGLEANFGVIDANGGAAWFEVHDLGFTRFDVKDAPEGYMIRTNWSVTGREGEGKGYDRFDIATSLMAAHEGGFDAEWIIDNLGREETIARDKTVCSVVIEGPGVNDAPNSAVLWCAPGYTPCCYAIPVWVTAGDEIAAPLHSKNAARGSALNELARRLLRRFYLDGDHSDKKAVIRENVLAGEETEFKEGRWLDAMLRAGEAGIEDVRKYNSGAEARFNSFRSKVSF